MKTILMTVSHGDCDNEITTTGETILAAFLALQSTPLGRSYAPGIESPRLTVAVAELESTGKHSLGWADCEVIP